MSLVLAGCAKYRIAPEAPPARETATPRGEITVRPGRPGYVVAAPHVTSDTATGEIAAAVAERTGFGLVVARGFAGGSEAWERHVRQAAGGPLALYVEIDGNGRQESAARIEVATVGVDREYALRLRTLYELIRDAHVRGHAQAPRLPMLVEPADPVLFAATGAKREGILRLPGRALHVELPRAARVEWRALYTEVLGDFLLEAARLRPPR